MEKQSLNPFSQSQEPQPCTSPLSGIELLSNNLEQISSPEEFLSAIDFDTLNNIFDTLEKKSNGPEGVQNLNHKILRENISFERDLDEHNVRTAVCLGTAQPDIGKINIKWDQPSGDTIPVENVIHLLSLITHEATHIRSSYSENTGPLIINHENQVWAQGFDRRSGVNVSHYDTSSDSETITTKKGLGLNEAITEDIGREVLCEYLRQTGNGRYLKDLNVLEQLGSGEYIYERIALASVILIMSHELEIPSDIVWQSFVHEYMSGNTNVTELFGQIESLLDSTSGIKKLFEEISEDTYLHEVYTFSELLDSISNPDLFIDPLLRILSRELRLKLMDDLESKATILRNGLGLHK